MATNDAPLNVAASRGLSLALGQATGAVPGSALDAIDGYPNSWEVEPDWENILTYDGAGSPDSSFDPDADFSYLGAFRVDNFSNSTNPSGARDSTAIEFRRPNGNNGTHGSLLIGRTLFVGEVEVPSLDAASTDVGSLPVAAVRQNWVNVIDSAPGGNPNGNNAIGWMREIGGRLFIACHASYSTGGSTDDVIVASSPDDLANSAYQGFLEAWGNDWGAKYIIDIPSDKQATFGGTHFAGICTHISITGRSSQGHSLISLTPSSVSPGDTAISNTTWVHYPLENPIGPYSEGGAVSGHYMGLINPVGTWDMSAYGYDSGAFADGSLQQYLAVPIQGTMSSINGVSLGPSDGRTRTSFAGLPLADYSSAEHTVTLATRSFAGIIPPGSNSVFHFGYNEGSRYGAPYKAYTVDLGPQIGADSGRAAAEISDADPWWWQMNLSDVENATNVYDPDYVKAKPWKEPGPFSYIWKIRGAAYDPVDQRFYVLKYIGSNDHIVCVYHLEAG